MVILIAIDSSLEKNESQKCPNSFFTSYLISGEECDVDDQCTHDRGNCCGFVKLNEIKKIKLNSNK